MTLALDWKCGAFTHLQEVGTASSGFRNHKGIKGKVGGSLPEGLHKTDFEHDRLVSHVVDTIRESTPDQKKRGNLWFTRTNEFAQHLAQKYNISMEKAAGVLAAISPAVPWEQNAPNAENFIATGKMGSGFKANYAKAQRILDGEDPGAVLKGKTDEYMKTFNFYHNIADPSDDTYITIDRHAVAMAIGKPIDDGLADDVLRYASYDTFKAAFREAAQKLKMSPNVVQSIGWIRWRENYIAKPQGLAKESLREAWVKGLPDWLQPAEGDPGYGTGGKLIEGGPGSGDHGHVGRPGEQGGSGGGGGTLTIVPTPAPAPVSEPAKEPTAADYLAKIALIHAAAKDAPYDPATVAAYDSFKAQTLQQYAQLKKDGITFEFGEDDPYPDSKTMRADVENNHHIKVYNVADLPAGHPLGEDAVDGQTYNTIFRGVHDVYGHAFPGNSFGPKGELGAYQAHSKMFTHDAYPALAAETLAQNAWVNYGPHNPQALAPKDRPFAEQKAYAFPLDVAEGASEGKFPKRLLGMKESEGGDDHYVYDPAHDDSLEDTDYRRPRTERKRTLKIVREVGNENSGDHNHPGNPGHVGGSGKGDGAADAHGDEYPTYRFTGKLYHATDDANFAPSDDKGDGMLGKGLYLTSSVPGKNNAYGNIVHSFELKDAKLLDFDSQRAYELARNVYSNDSADSGESAFIKAMEAKGYVGLSDDRGIKGVIEVRIFVLWKPTKTAKMIEVIREGNSDQPRDDHGRWASGGASEADRKTFDDAHERFTDNPGGQWEKDNPQKLTAGYNKSIMMPSQWLASLKGMEGEHTRLSMNDPRVVAIADDIKENGYDKSRAVFVNVEANGEAKINEGNHRARAAVLAGLDKTPVELRMYGGGEKKFHPTDIAGVE